MLISDKGLKVTYVFGNLWEEFPCTVWGKGVYLFKDNDVWFVEERE